ncbi:uncharacterized protein LOC123320968 [Coccinella septempunctata]|uniref:uncharacterized protein LOC123320504 n=1 Tax=Coccinella septempunctata TaxID=41139 RepID=UPI001D06D650|nr:uncharacterized protein LOC123320504 [Coccinella septempunctata]XP_044764404.1 uncharacterized protein LOC123320968 [Coccinella septempunctata]
MSKNCKICNKPVGRKNPGLECHGFCKRSYHQSCLLMTHEVFIALRSEGITWACSDCRTLDSPRRFTAGPRVATTSAIHAPEDEVDLVAAIGAMRADLQSIRSQQTELLTSVNFCSNKITDFEAQLKEMRKSISKIDDVVAENKRLRAELDQVNRRLTDMEQMSRINNLEIVGVPEVRNENLVEIFEKITESLNCKMNASDIDDIHRVPINKNGSSQIKNIVVKLHSRRNKENLLAAVKQTKSRSKIKSNSIKVDGVSDHLYINEHLTLNNKLLFKEARETAKSKNYKYVWIKNCNIYMRKDDSSRVLQIRSHDNLLHLK